MNKTGQYNSGALSPLKKKAKSRERYQIRKNNLRLSLDSGNIFNN